MDDGKPRLLQIPRRLMVARVPHGGWVVQDPGTFPGEQSITLKATDSLTMALSWIEMALQGDASIVCQPTND